MNTDSEIVLGVENQALPREQTAQKVAVVAKTLEVETLRGRNVSPFPDGEKQKVAFVSVYAMGPMIYLLDKPSSNLGMETVDALKTCLKEPKSQEKTILTVEHRLYYSMGTIDRILVLGEG